MRKTIALRRPSTEFQPRVHRDLLRGIDLIVNVVRPTIGPFPRYVGMERVSRDRSPELLSDAGTLARRIIQIGDDASDVGAMLMRQAVWQVGERVGDGTATTAVLAQAMLHHAYRSVAAGANAMRVREGIRQATSAAVGAIQAQATPVTTQKALAQIARSHCHDDELADMLGEIYSIIGMSGYVDVQSSSGRSLEREYVEGAFWRTGWISSAFSGTAMRRAELQDAAIMLVDGRISNVEALARAVGTVMSAGHTAIGIVCNGMSDSVISVLAHNHQKGTFKCLPVKTPASSSERKYFFDDLAVITGGTPLVGDTEADLSLFSADMIGKTRRLWADTLQFGLVAGKGSAKALRAHISVLRKAIGATKDKAEVDALRKRLGRLMGGTAMLSVGARTETEQKLRQEIAERSVHFMNSVTESGMVAGGGAAFLDCIDAVKALLSDDPDVHAGISAVARALEEPMRAIAANAGEPPSATIARARRDGRGHGLNVLTGRVEDMRKAGIVDSANVLENALATAASVATMVLTTDVVVRHRKPITATEP
ncbi:MAG: chaperonin GroEL [Chloroflexi bacterium]|nr:chaperonin GroEL [Chloroflexota bacterium]